MNNDEKKQKKDEILFKKRWMNEISLKKLIRRSLRKGCHFKM